MAEPITDEQTGTIDEYITAGRSTQPALRFPRVSAGEPADTGTAILKTLKRQLDRLDIEVDALYDERFINTANNDHLERIAARYDLDRKTNEPDSKLRQRTEAARRVAQSRGTYQDVAKVALALLNADPAEIEMVRPSESGEKGTGIVRVNSNVLDDTPLSNSELITILTEAAIGGHRIVIEEKNAFRYGDPANGWGSTWAQIIE